MWLTNVPFIHCSEKLEYCRRLRDALSAVFEVVDDFGERHWYFEKPYADIYLLPGGAPNTNVRG